MKRFSLVLFLSLLLVLTACTSKEDRISSEDLNKYGEMARTAINYLNQGDAEKIHDMASPELREALSEEAIAEVYENILSLGAFVEFGDSDGLYQLDEKTNERYLLVFQKVKYEDKELLFTTSFNGQGELAGIFYK